MKNYFDSFTNKNQTPPHKKSEILHPLVLTTANAPKLVSPNLASHLKSDNFH